MDNSWSGRLDALNIPSGDQVTVEDRQALAELCKGKAFAFEIGTYLGATTEAMLCAMDPNGVVVTFDTFEGLPQWARIGPEPKMCRSIDILTFARERLARFEGRAIIFPARSPQVARVFADEIADIVFVDGSHAYADVVADIRWWLPKLKPDGLMIGHDFDKECEEPLDPDEFERRAEYLHADGGYHYGVAKAVKECFSRYVLAESPKSTIWWARPEWRVTS